MFINLYLWLCMDSYVDYYYIIDALGVDYNQSVWLPQTGL